MFRLQVVINGFGYEVTILISININNNIKNSYSITSLHRTSLKHYKDVSCKLILLLKLYYKIRKKGAYFGIFTSNHFTKVKQIESNS